MTFKFTQFSFVTACAAIFMTYEVNAVAPEKEAEAKALQSLQETEAAELGEPQPNNVESALTPEEKEEEVINEDNVMNPFPG